MADNAILTRMLDRLYAALVRGPSLNCRPHSSRQRVDLAHLLVLGDARSRALRARVEVPPDLPENQPGFRYGQPQPTPPTQSAPPTAPRDPNVPPPIPVQGRGPKGRVESAD